MTTQHMHFEHSDADAAVAGHSSTPGDGETTEQVAVPTTLAATQADKDAAQIDTSLSEPASDASSQEEARRVSQELPPALSHEQQQEEILTMSAEHMQHEQNHQSDTSPAVNPPATGTATSSAGQEGPALPEQPAGQQTGPSGADSPPLTQEEEEIRPFTAFIEEFRQAEARLSASVQQSEAEVFSLLIPIESASTDRLTETVQEAIPPVQVGETPSVPSDASGASAGSLAELLSETGEASEASAPLHDGINGNSTETAATLANAGETALAPGAEAVETEGTEKGVEQAATEQGRATEERQKETARTEEPAVSPLLRPGPPPRLRSSRYAGRHYRAHQEAQETEPGETGATEVTEASGPAEEPSPTPVEQPEALAPAPSPSEAVEETERPRPARKYRFDRPAVAGKTAAQPAPQQPRGEEQRVAQAPQSLIQAPAQEGNAVRQDMAAGVAAAPAAENQVSEQAPVVPEEAPPAQVTPPLTPPASEPGRRRQPQEKAEKVKEQKEQKEQATQAPASMPPAAGEAAPAAQQPSGQPVAPEDLPPLEYAELQKASSRRRRRHRSGSSNAAAPAQPVQPASPPSPPSPPSPAPATPPANATAASQPAQYSIVSGYTVNQMNQGNETSGPFMAPEPSPARGSLFIRDGRSSRAESLRTSASAFPATRTTHEGGLSTAAINQLTTAITQAFQVQTDRMVAELRRSTQAPTNISVSLPPFPSNERVGVFVDVANLLYSARTMRIAVDFGKLLDFLRGNRRLVRAHAYCPTSPQPGDEQMFLQAVKGLGYRITTKNYKTFSSGAKKADLDLDLCMDVVRLVDGRAVDCIVLVSGDSDFMPMLDYCSDHGVRVEVAAFDEAMSATLRQSCDLFINLSMLEEIRA